MQISTASFNTYDICAITGEMKIAEIAVLTQTLHKYVQANQGIDLVLDLSGTTFIDSSALRMLINLKKHLDAFGHKLYLFNLSPPINNLIHSVNLDREFEIITDYEKFQRDVAAGEYSLYSQYAWQEGDQKRVSCSCAVCGSSNVIAYLIDPHGYDWKWQEDDPFPMSFIKGTTIVFDVFRLMPILCLECCTCSVELSHFNILDKQDQIVVHSKLDEQSRAILSKSIKKRKKMLEVAGIAAERFFINPRDNAACCQLYLLAENCAHAMAVEKICATHFTLGYLNYLAIRYAPFEQKAELITNCRTWLTQIFAEEQVYHHHILAKALFILMNASLNANKIKDAAQAYRDFQDLMKTIPSHVPASGIDNPHFWFEQATVIWHREIESKSNELKHTN
jgi:anti-anti-sigma factor